MTGFLRQRGSSWELRVYAGRDVVTGRKRWVTKTVRGGKREAQRALAAMVADNDRRAHSHTNATVGELLEEWFALAGPGYSPKGARETRDVMDRNLLPFLGNVPCPSSAPPTSTASTVVSARRAGGPVDPWDQLWTAEHPYDDEAFDRAVEDLLQDLGINPADGLNLLVPIALGAALWIAALVAARMDPRCRTLPDRVAGTLVVRSSGARLHRRQPLFRGRDSMARQRMTGSTSLIP